MPPLFRKRIGAPHSKHFSKDPLFKVSLKILLRKTPDTVPSWHHKICALHSRIFLKNPPWKCLWIISSQIVSRSKKYWRKIETVCPYIFSRVKLLANFNTLAQDFLFHPLNIEAYFSFITSLRNIKNVALGSINSFSFEKVAFVMRMCLKRMFLFPK